MSMDFGTTTPATNPIAYRNVPRNTIYAANPNGLLLPGAYTVVHLRLPGADGTVTVPSDTLLFRREGLRVAIVRDGRTQLVPVTIGRDYGEKVEILTGLHATDNVIVDPSDSLISGTAVRVEEAKQG